MREADHDLKEEMQKHVEDQDLIGHYLLSSIAILPGSGIMS